MLFVSDKLYPSDLKSIRVRPLTYISWVVVLLEACDITNNGCHLGHHLGFYHNHGFPFLTI